MRARADEVEVADAVIAVMRAEPRRLPQQRFEAERRTQMRVQLAMEIGGREDVERHHIAPEAGDQELLQIVEDTVAVERPDRVPIDRQLGEMRHRSTRSQEQREGKTGVSTCRLGWPAYD